MTTKPVPAIAATSQPSRRTRDSTPFPLRESELDVFVVTDGSSRQIANARKLNKRPLSALVQIQTACRRRHQLNQDASIVHGYIGDVCAKALLSFLTITGVLTLASRARKEGRRIKTLWPHPAPILRYDAKVTRNTDLQPPISSHDARRDRHSNSKRASNALEPLQIHGERHVFLFKVPRVPLESCYVYLHVPCRWTDNKKTPFLAKMRTTAKKSHVFKRKSISQVLLQLYASRGGLRGGALMYIAQHVWVHHRNGTESAPIPHRLAIQAFHSHLAYFQVSDESIAAQYIT